MVVNPRTRCCIPRKKRDDTPTLRFDKFQCTYPCKHASEHVLRQTPAQSAHKCMMCKKTRNTNTCRGHTLHNFMTTVSIKLANKKKKRNGTKWHKLSTLHTITLTLKTVDSVFGHTCVLVSSHRSSFTTKPKEPTKHITTHTRASIRLQMRWRERQTPLTNDQTPSAPSDQILAEKVISSPPSNSKVANMLSSRCCSIASNTHLHRSHSTFLKSKMDQQIVVRC